MKKLRVAITNSFNSLSSPQNATTRYNIVVVGDASVGKTALIRELLNKKFTDDYHPNVEERVFKKKFLVDDEMCVLHITDTIASEEFRTDLFVEYAQNHVDGFLLTFAVDHPPTLAHIDDYIHHARGVMGTDDVPIVLAGNKCDLGYCDVNRQLVEETATLNGLVYVETSAKTGTGCEAAFDAMVRAIRKCRASGLPLTKEKLQLKRSREGDVRPHSALGLVSTTGSETSFRRLVFGVAVGMNKVRKQLSIDTAAVMRQPV